jgi:endonuclease/exonuclease/phosphatase family metal-dependent hydrolase
MRIITWNLRYDNKRTVEAVQNALQYNPDVLCLQEVPQETLAWLQKLEGYYVNSSYDFTHLKDARKNGYICTLTRLEPIDILEITYDDDTYTSLLNKIYYLKLAHNQERHTALVVCINTKQGQLQIVNTRLSCAIGTLDRLLEFKTMEEKIHYQQIPTIFCGDFNVVDSKWFNWVTGWIRGFARYDYQINERQSFESLFNEANLVNIFHGYSTIFLNKPLLQLDHILIPKDMTVTYKEISQKCFGSDHRMLLADISLPEIKSGI